MRGVSLLEMADIMEAQANNFIKFAGLMHIWFSSAPNTAKCL